MQSGILCSEKPAQIVMASFAAIEIQAAARVVLPPIFKVCIELRNDFIGINQGSRGRLAPGVIYMRGLL